MTAAFAPSRTPVPTVPTRWERVRADAPDRLEAALVGAGPHLEAVLDVGTTESGDLLLVLPEPAARLTELAAVPGWPSAGEAVTVLVPLAQALERLHGAGVALSVADASAVLLDADGAAAWCVPERPVLLRRAGAAAFSAAVEQDLAAFHALARALVEKAGGRLRIEPGTGADALVDALFEVADPRPVRLGGPPEPVPDLPGRLLGAVPEHPPAAPDAGVTALGRLRAAAAPLRAVRPRAWAAAGAAIAALLVALVVLPGPRADAERALPASPRPSVVPIAIATGPVAPRSLPGEQAVGRLLAARRACLRTGAARCLAAVDAAGSPVSSADRAALAAGADPVLPGSGRARVLSSGGGTVLARVGGAVVAAVRQPEGWRLRDVVAEPPG